jgi:membrane peptidoglycan carboxypeptidase
MVENGSLPAAAAAAAKAAPLGVVAGGPQVPGRSCMAAAPDAGFFCSYVVQYLEQAGFTADQLATGGYTITTTMDPSISATIKAAVDRNAPPTQPGVANTFALIRPGSDSHQVLAMVANRSFGVDAARGQTTTNIVAGASNTFGAGSSFKIFTTAAALESGQVGFDSRLPNPPQACVPPSDGGPCYTVRNDGVGYPDPISLPDALATSPNVAFVDLEQKVGVPAVVQMAQRLGLRNTLATNDAGGTPITDPGNPLSTNPQYNQPQSQYFQSLPSFTLGDSPVSPLEMANVTATLMSGGTWCPPDPVLSVTDRNGQPVQIAQQPCEQVVSRGLANTLMAGLSKDTVSGTTAASAHAAGWSRPGIGKTGTTEKSESVAFVGGVDGYAASSMLFADGRQPQELCPGPPVHLGSCGSGAFGGTVAAPPYFQAMSQILAGQRDTPVPGPDPGYLQVGARPAVVPYVVGKQDVEAQQQLQQAGYRVVVQQVASSLPQGQVAGQTPQGNAGPDTEVTLYVSAGPGPKQ